LSLSWLLAIVLPRLRYPTFLNLNKIPLNAWGWRSLLHGVRLGPRPPPASVREYLQLKLHDCKAENFGAVFLDNQHRVLCFEEMFQGTIDGAQVHPRVVVQRALEANAAAVILYHNHPSGLAEPSRADENITSRLKDALSLVDVRVLDHFVVGAEDVTSFAERGLL
jgi:DNA repair protein RadC